jgi:hypothetical protein
VPPTRAHTIAQRRRKTGAAAQATSAEAANVDPRHKHQKTKTVRKLAFERRVCKRYEEGASLAALADEFHRRPQWIVGILSRSHTPVREETRQELRELRAASRGRVPRMSEADPAGSGTPGTALQSEAASVMKRLLAEASSDELRKIVQLADPTPQEEDAEASPWGPPPTPDKLADAVLANTRKSFAARREVEQDSLSRSAVAAALGTSATAVTDRLEARKLVGLKRGREWLIPSWQLHADSKDGLLPGLAELIATFPGGPVSLSAWVKKPAVDLDGQTPLEGLSKGRVDDVVRLARQLSSAGW